MFSDLKWVRAQLHDPMHLQAGPEYCSLVLEDTEGRGSTLKEAYLILLLPISQIPFCQTRSSGGFVVVVVMVLNSGPLSLSCTPTPGLQFYY